MAACGLTPTPRRPPGRHEAVGEPVGGEATRVRAAEEIVAVGGHPIVHEINGAGLHGADPRPQ